MAPEATIIVATACTPTATTSAHQLPVDSAMTAPTVRAASSVTTNSGLMEATLAVAADAPLRSAAAGSEAPAGIETRSAPMACCSSSVSAAFASADRFGSSERTNRCSVFCRSSVAMRDAYPGAEGAHAWMTAVPWLAGRGGQQVGLGAAAPLDEHRRGIVLQLSRLALDDGLAQPAQRLRSRLPGGRLPLDELAEAGNREHLAVALTGLGQPVGVEQQEVPGLERLLGQLRRRALQRDPERGGRRRGQGPRKSSVADDERWRVPCADPGQAPGLEVQLGDDGRHVPVAGELVADGSVHRGVGLQEPVALPAAVSVGREREGGHARRRQAVAHGVEDADMQDAVVD